MHHSVARVWKFYGTQQQMLLDGSVSDRVVTTVLLGMLCTELQCRHTEHVLQHSNTV